MEKSWLGIDCGSVSVKTVLIDEEGNLVRESYLRNRGIIETVKKGLEEIANNEYKVSGVGVTGSGRKFVAMLVGADIVKTEVLAHTVGTLKYHPDVRTLMDIGGEDCKLMSIRDGILENFVLNNVCGAGTGAVLDSIASRMGIKIQDVGDLALQYKQRLEFPGKCGVFAQSSVVSRLNSGAEKSDILMGVIRGLVNNYLALAKGMKLEPPYVYQGATAQNKAIVFALENQLEHKVIVPEHCSTMGAIGIALMAQKNGIGKTRFKGYNSLTEKNYTTKNIISNGCENHCELTFLYEDNRIVGVIGNKCDNCVQKSLYEGVK